MASGIRKKIDRSRNRKRVLISAIHYAGKLFQQYIVDAYVKIEQNRLAFHVGYLSSGFTYELSLIRPTLAPSRTQ
jgi:hypothetical protein